MMCIVVILHSLVEGNVMKSLVLISIRVVPRQINTIPIVNLVLYVANVDHFDVQKTIVKQ